MINWPGCKLFILIGEQRGPGVESGSAALTKSPPIQNGNN
uniref:Uncharacterized protein n=1 Tax=Anguilla anguilla TaxID=7936 RepID=A0A0E9P9X9_ANGAN